MKRKIQILSVLSLSVFGYAAAVFAAPNLPSVPAGGYLPGTEIDPVCAPNSADCVVRPLSAENGLTLAGTSIGLGGTLVRDTDIVQGTNTLASTFSGATGTYTFLNGNLGALQGVGSFYAPTATPHIVTASVVTNAGAVLATKDYATTEQSGISAWVDPGTGEHRAVLGTRANDAAKDYNITSFAQGGTIIMSEYDSALDFTGKDISINSDEIRQSLNYSRIDNQNYLYNEMKMDDTSLHFSIGNSVVAGVFSGSGKEYLLSNAGHEFKGLDLIANQYPSNRDDSGAFSPANFLYTDNNGKILSASTSLLGGSSSWSLTGNAGTDGGVTSFIGTTDAEDFVVKTNGNKIATFGQFGNIAMGTDVVASGDYAIALGLESAASGYASTALGFATTASGLESTAFGNSSNALGDYSIAAGTSATASGDFSTAIGTGVYARSFSEIALGHSNIDYTPVSTVLFEPADRLFSIGNLNHNAYTLWKDGSFAYNDDNFQNDDFGVEQNMFYFNYGSHDGLGAAQTKRAIRLGSTINDEWDINSANVGDRSIVIGFGDDTFGAGSIASGLYSIAFGSNTNASGVYATAFGNSSIASGNISTAFGQENLASGGNATAFGLSNTASGDGSVTFGGYNNGEGNYSTVFGQQNFARSFSETSLGMQGTDYVANDATAFDAADRLLNIGNGNGAASDAFTILKNGQTGIAIDNFEANTNGSIFQVGDGGTGVIGYVNTGTGAWVAVSDARKKNSIQDLSYGLDTVLALSPKSYIMNESGEHSIGFLAQDVLTVVPEAVFGSESKGYGMSYATLVPVTVKAIQQLNLKLADIQKVADATDQTFVTNIRNWFANKANGINKIFVKQLCLTDGTDEECVTMEQLRQLKQGMPSAPASPALIVPVVTPDPAVPDPSLAPDPAPEVPDPVVDPVPDPVVAPDPVPVIDPAPDADPAPAAE